MRKYGFASSRCAGSSGPWPTLSEGWSVRDLVQHMAGGRHHVSPDSLWRDTDPRRGRGGSVSRSRPQGRSGNGVLPTNAPHLRPLGPLGRAVTHPVMGEILCSQFLGMRVGATNDDHAWGLAWAIGADDHLAPDLVVRGLDRDVADGKLHWQEWLFRLGTERRSQRRCAVAESASRPFRTSPLRQRTVLDEVRQSSAASHFQLTLIVSSPLST